MRRTMRRTWRVLAAAAMVGTVAAGCTQVGSSDNTYSFVSPGGQTRIFYPPDQRKPLPDMGGESLRHPGQKVHLSDFRNQVMVINLWGAWCPPCRAEADDLQRVQDQMKDSGVQVLGVDVRDYKRSDPMDFVRDRHITYPSIYDPPGRSLLALKGYPRSAVPSTIVLDRQHRVAAVYLTQLLDTELLPQVQKVAGEQPGKPAPQAPGKR